jgi:hypothetical protein
MGNAVQIDGKSWRQASSDIAIAGLGWVSLTAPGTFKIKVSAPVGTTISTRDPMMPFEAKKTSARHTGSRFIRKGTSGGIGWRA